MGDIAIYANHSLHLLAYKALQYALAYCHLELLDELLSSALVAAEMSDNGSCQFYHRIFDTYFSTVRSSQVDACLDHRARSVISNF